MGETKENPARDKSYAFALRIIGIYKQLCESTKEYILSKQLLRAGTSIGANVEEAIGAQSKKDFSAKMSIAYKECRETHYWLRLLRDSAYLDTKLAESMLSDCDELCKIIGSITRTLLQ
ncbi:MAG: four helix bundle protein [Chitinispirillaceae bacterium]|nr:four helix bundle protein [Chitinispirillaceae bacterium]